MDPELKSLLTENLALTKDNHRMLRAMRRDAWFGFVGKIIFWVALIVIPLYFLQPYLTMLPTAEQFEQVMKLYQGQY